MCVVFYVSGHGLGHATREISILQALPNDIPLVIKTVSPEWHWRNELSEYSFEYVAATFDVGSIQKDSLDSDAHTTLAAWQELAAWNNRRFADEQADLRNRGAKLIISDVPSFPITVAHTLEIPSICVANFTWADIYNNLATEEPGLLPVTQKLEMEYAQTTLLLEVGQSLPMPYFPQREDIGLIARTGVERRSELLEVLPNSAHGKRLALVYAGNWGLPIPYEKLAQFTDWHFLSLGQNDNALPTNWTVLSRTLMAHPDLVASVDVVVSKIGYGLVGECLTGGTPIIYCPRNGFAEYPVIDTYLSARPNGLRIPTAQFASGNWGAVLDSVPARGTIPKEDAPGAKRAADQIATLYRNL